MDSFRHKPAKRINNPMISDPHLVGQKSNRIPLQSHESDKALLKRLLITLYKVYFIHKILNCMILLGYDRHRVFTTS